MAKTPATIHNATMDAHRAANALLDALERLWEVRNANRTKTQHPTVLELLRNKVEEIAAHEALAD